MDNLEFVQGLYNGKYCYSDSMTEEQIALLRIPSGVEDIIRRMVAENRIIFLTGNPGDGKTYLIKAIKEHLQDVFIQTDMNRVREEEIDSLMVTYKALAMLTSVSKFIFLRPVSQ